MDDKPAAAPRPQEEVGIKAEAAQAIPQAQHVAQSADGGLTSKYCRCEDGEGEVCGACLNYREWMARKDAEYQDKRERQEQARYRQSMKSEWAA